MPQSPQQRADYNARLDRFAELVSLDIPVPFIAERMGIGRVQAHNMMARLRRMYGEG